MSRRFEGLKLLPLLVQSAEVQEQVRLIRNSLPVRVNMYSDHEISQDEHANWLRSLEGNDRERPMVVLLGRDVVGYVALRNIQNAHKVADWAFYIDEESQGRGLGSAIEFRLLELAFGEMRLEKLNCEVLATNEAVINLHKKFGFQLEGIRRSNVSKSGKRVDVHLLGIVAGEWQSARGRFMKMFGE